MDVRMYGWMYEAREKCFSLCHIAKGKITNVAELAKISEG